MRRTRQFAVRQERWFRRDPRVRWVELHDDPVAEVLAALADLPGRHDPPADPHQAPGLGNDFLVVFDPHVDDLAGAGPAAVRPPPRRRRRRAARRHAEPTATTPGWCCYNADGSRAEMSGNGIRCFAQALAARLGAP